MSNKIHAILERIFTSRSNQDAAAFRYSQIQRLAQKKKREDKAKQIKYFEEL